MAIHNSLLGSLKAVEKKIETIPNNIAKAVKKDSEDVTPVDTGKLKKGYEIEKSNRLGDDAVIKNEVPYAIYVEFGTTKMHPRAMMRYGVSQVSEKADKYVG